jgi:hypothetical protein
MWSGVQAALEAERADRPLRPWAAGVRVSMFEPRTARDMGGRGAIAVAPGRALRMILVGAAGATMLDAWVAVERWRFSLPPAGIVRRGGPEDPADLPVGFLRWSLFRPLSGTLVAGSLAPQRVFLLREGGIAIEVRFGRCDRGKLVTTTRRGSGRAERIDECRAPAPPHTGDWVRYRDEISGLRVELWVESLSGEPEEQAFRDPDAAEVAP